MLLMRNLLRLAAIFLLTACSDPYKDVLQLKDCKDETEYSLHSQQFHRIIKNDETSGSYLARYLATHCMNRPFAKKVMALPKEITIAKAIEEGKIGSSLEFFFMLKDKISPPIDQKAVERWQQLAKEFEIPEPLHTTKAKNYPSWDLRLINVGSVAALKGEIVFYDEFGDELFRSGVYISNDPQQHQITFPIPVPSEKIGLLDGSSLTKKGACFAPGLRIQTTQGVEIVTNFPHCSQ